MTDQERAASVAEYDQFRAWLADGIRRKWISEARCETHEGVVLSDAEYNLIEDGEDICINVVRIYGPNNMYGNEG